MTERFIRQVSVLLALVGIGLVGYILYARHSGSPLLCSTGGCEAVQTSRYSEIFGVPIAAFGLVGYATALAAAVAPGEWARTAQMMVALTAFLFSGYLLFVQVHLVGAICDWCLASDAVTTALVVTALLRIQAIADSGASGQAQAASLGLCFNEQLVRPVPRSSGNARSKRRTWH